MNKPPLLIPMPETDIPANSLIDITNPAKEGLQQRFYVAHAGTNPTGDNIGMLCFPVTPFHGAERPSRAHAMLKTPDIETLQMIDFTAPLVVIHMPNRETPLLCAPGPSYSEKYTAKVLAASNEASTNETNPLISTYRKIFAPVGSSGDLGTNKYEGGRMTTRYDVGTKGDGLMSTEAKDQISPTNE